MFSFCGSITKIEIRVSGGQAVTRGVEIPEPIMKNQDRVYATVEFADVQGVKRALTLNGREYKGEILVVSSASVNSLPI